MAFNTAVSGLRAANSDLSVTGHNIANASTVGFKASRAEFADLYSNSLLGSGNVTIGSGVLLPAVTQQFNQGNINFTNNSLDLAINGNGFLIMENEGAVEYTRDGQIQLDRDGFMISNQGKRLQGFQANSSGTISGILSDLQISTENQPPLLTSNISAVVNLDAQETPVAFGSRSSAGAAVGTVQTGAAQPSNGYPVENLSFTAIDGTSQTLSVVAGESADSIANRLSALTGVDASATSTATLGNINLTTTGVDLILNGQVIGEEGDIAQSIADNINSNTNLAGISATVIGGEVTITSDTGVDLEFEMTGGGLATADSVSLQGLDTSAVPVTLDNDPATLTDFAFATVGGTVTLAVDEDLAVESDLAGTGIFANDPNDTTSPFFLALEPSFNPADPDTYNHATSLTIFDSLGVPHIMTQYFVKESDLSDTVVNRWRMYVQIDGQNVGDPNPNGPSPGEPTIANFSVVFNADGSLNGPDSDNILISNWTPRDADGNPNGALGPLNVSQGGSTIIPDPPTSSNLVIDLTGATQFGSSFAVTELDQNGYTTGRLAGLSIGDDGVIFGRFTNGQSLAVGQVALADFTNEQGLSPIGDTSWAETFASGEPVVGTPNSGSLGVIQSGALEESTTELSEELVNLIIAQRNFQANAKTIQTADALTQTIINIR